MNTEHDVSVNPDKIRNAVAKMLEVNFSIQPNDRVLVLTDFPATDLLKRLSAPEMEAQLQRSMLARWVYEIAKLAFPENNFEFLPFQATGLNGMEPPEKVPQALLTADIGIAITSYSLTHTKARNDATDRGVKIASMPGFLVDMFYPGGAMDADYHMIANRTLEIQSRLEGVSEIKISNKQGTDLEFSIQGRKKFAETGLIERFAKPCNLPAGEAGCSPVEGTTNGRIVLEKGWHKSLSDGQAAIAIEEGFIKSIVGPKKFVEEMDRILRVGIDQDPYKSRRNIAEFGIGTNPNAKKIDNTLEAEKILGTIHIGYGNNFFMGGKVNADFHSDFVVNAPSVWLDREIFMNNGDFSSPQRKITV